MSECTFAKYSLCTEHSGDPRRQMKQRDRKLPLSTVAKGSETKDKIIKLSPLLSADNQNPQNMSGASYALSFLVLTRLISTHPLSLRSAPPLQGVLRETTLHSSITNLKPHMLPCIYISQSEGCYS